MKTPRVKSIHRSALRRGSLIPLVLPFFALAPQAGAVCQEDCDAYNNTFLGDDLFLIGIGSRNVPVGLRRS